MRLDLSMFAFQYTSEQLSVIAKNIVIICFVVSSAEVILPVQLHRFSSPTAMT